MTEDTPRTYTADEVNRIIRRALKIDQGESVTHEELLETARELGLDPSKIEAAVKQESAAMDREKKRMDYLAYQKSRFRARLWTFGILNAVLFLINCITPGPWWFQWVLLGTGISLAIRFRKAYFPTDYQVERALVRRELRRKMVERALDRREHLRKMNVF